MQQILLALGLLLPAVAWGDDYQQMQQIAGQFKLISPEHAEAIALEARPGMIDDIELDNRKLRGGWQYEVEIIDLKGREWDVYIDAASGELLKIRRDWF